MIEPVTLIVTALAAGASAGTIDALKDNAKETASAAYGRLRELARKRVAGRPDGKLALERHENAPQKWETVLIGELTEAGAASDTALLSAAETLLELIDQTATKSDKYSVTIKNSKGIQIGEKNIQINRP